MLPRWLRPETGSAGPVPGSRVLVLRLATALVQAAALYALLAVVLVPHRGLARHPALFLPLALVAAGIPLLVILGAGRLPARMLALWAAAAAVLLAAFGWWDVARRPPNPAPGVTDLPDALVPWWPLLPALAMGFFVANVLVTDAVLERRWMPPYPRHIDTAWKQALQTAFVAVFVGLFWSVLGLGAGLFLVLDIDLFGRLLRQPWFAIPATALAIALAVHVTDVQPGLIRGARTVALLLLSWLLPLMAAIVLAFLLALPFTSLQPLWQTHFAALLLVSAAGWLVVLINTAYGDGDAWSGSWVKRGAALAASLELVPLAGLAATALVLRVAQYGWTVNRIFAAAVLAVLACYAVGYAAAALSRRASLLERTNFATAHGALLLLLLLFSPVADPARLMVASQVSRLRTGVIAPGAFDFAALKGDGARWGAAALDRLRADPDAAIATAARTSEEPAQGKDTGTPEVLEPDQLVGRVAVVPAGRSLPASFVHMDFGPGGVPDCFRPGTMTCTVRFLALTPDAPEVILLLNVYGTDVFEQDTPDHWRKAGTLLGRVTCPAVQKRLRNGEGDLVPHPARDLVVDGVRLVLVPLSQDCPSDPGP